MKKNLIISFLIFIILISFLGSTYAAVTVTEETIESSFNRLKEYAKNSENGMELTDEYVTLTIDKINKQIELGNDEYSFIVDYDFSKKPTFTANLSFNSQMSKDEWEEEAGKQSLLMLLFVLVAENEGIEFMDSMFYIFSAMFKDLNFTPSFSETSNNNTEATNAIEYAKSMYDNMNETINDDLFTLTTKKILETEDEYNVSSTLTINPNADFSVLDKYTDNTMNQLTNSIQNNIINQQESVNKVTNSISKLPQTGNFFNVQDALFLLIIICTAGIIFLIVPNSKYKK